VGAGARRVRQSTGGSGRVLRVRAHQHLPAARINASAEVRKPFGRAADRRADCRLKRAGASPRRQRRHASAAAEAAPRGESAQGQAGSRAEQPVDRTLRFRYARAEPRLRRLPSLALRLLSMLTPTATTFRYPAGALLQPRQRPQRADGADFCGTSSAARPCLAGQSAVSIHAKVRASTKRECKVFPAHPCDRTLLMETD
jgi:hypothetical protein